VEQNNGHNKPLAGKGRRTSHTTNREKASYSSKKGKYGN
jgi:hypothetical protein